MRESLSRIEARSPVRARAPGTPRARGAVAAVMLLALGARMLSAQTLTLGEAMRRADTGAYGNRIAQGTAQAQGAQTLAAMRGVLPSVRLEAGYVRTTDPIAAFGTTLRQRRITPADFDPTRLNDPAAIGNFAGGVVIEQPVLNADALAGRAAAARAAAASRATAHWTRLATRTDVVRAYYGAILAAERVATLDTAAVAAHEHVRQAESMARNGLVTRSDVLLASVKAGELDAQRIAAAADARTARQQLAVLLGLPPDTAIVLPAHLPSPEPVRMLASGEVADPPVDERADVQAARLGEDAARADVTRARSLYLPRLNSFARVDWNAAARPFAGTNSWTVGLMASWTPFAGASELAEVRAARGREQAARAVAAGAAAQARVDIERTTAQADVAVAQLAIAEHGAAQSAEAHRIVARKYDGGLAGIVELLDAAAVDTRSRLELAQATYRAIVAHAERLQANGQDPAAVAALDAPSEE